MAPSSTLPLSPMSSQTSCSTPPSPYSPHSWETGRIADSPKSQSLYNQFKPIKYAERKSSSLSPDAAPFIPKKYINIVESALPYSKAPHKLNEEQINKIISIWNSKFEIKRRAEARQDLDLPNILGSITLALFHEHFSSQLEYELKERFPYYKTSFNPIIKDLRLVGSGANHVLVGSDYSDIDLSYYLDSFPDNINMQKELLEIAQQVFLSTLAFFTEEYQAALSKPYVNKENLIFDLKDKINSAYLTNSKIVQDEENIWRITGIDKLDIKFVFKIKREYTAATFGQQISLRSPFFYSLGGKWENVLSLIENKELCMPKPEEVGLPRFLHELTRHKLPSFETITPVLERYLKNENLPANSLKTLLEKHLQNKNVICSKKDKLEHLLLIIESLHSLLPKESIKIQVKETLAAVQTLLKEHASKHELIELALKNTAKPALFKTIIHCQKKDSQGSKADFYLKLLKNSLSIENLNFLKDCFQQEKIKNTECILNLAQAFLKQNEGKQAFDLLFENFALFSLKKDKKQLAQIFYIYLGNSPQEIVKQAFPLILENSYFVELYLFDTLKELKSQEKLLKELLVQNPLILQKLETLTLKNPNYKQSLSEYYQYLLLSDPSSQKLLSILKENAKNHCLDNELQTLFFEKLLQNPAAISLKEAKTIEKLIQQKKYPASFFKPLIPHISRLFAKAALRESGQNPDLMDNHVDSALNLLQTAQKENLLSEKERDLLSLEIYQFWQKQDYSWLRERTIDLFALERSFLQQNQQLAESAIEKTTSFETVERQFAKLLPEGHPLLFLLLKQMAELYLQEENKNMGKLDVICSRGHMLPNNKQQFFSFFLKAWTEKSAHLATAEETSKVFNFIKRSPSQLSKLALNPFYLALFQKQIAFFLEQGKPSFLKEAEDFLNLIGKSKFLTQNIALVFDSLLPLSSKKPAVFFNFLEKIVPETLTVQLLDEISTFLDRALNQMDSITADQFETILNLIDKLTEGKKHPIQETVLKLFQNILESNISFDLNEHNKTAPNKLDYFTRLKVSKFWQNNLFIKEKKELFLKLLQSLPACDPKEKTSQGIAKDVSLSSKTAYNLCFCEFALRKKFSYAFTAQDFEVIQQPIINWINILPLPNPLQEDTFANTAIELQKAPIQILEFYALFKFGNLDQNETIETRKEIFNAFLSYLTKLTVITLESGEMPYYNSVNYALLLKAWGLALHQKWKHISSTDAAALTNVLFSNLSSFFSFPLQYRIPFLSYIIQDQTHLNPREVNSFYAVLEASDKHNSFHEMFKKDLKEAGSDLSFIMSNPYFPPQMIIWKIMEDIFIKKQLDPHSLCVQLHEDLKNNYRSLVKAKFAEIMKKK